MLHGIFAIGSLLIVGGLLSFTLGAYSAVPAQMVLGALLLLLGIQLLRRQEKARIVTRILLLFAVWLRAIAVVVAIYWLFISPHQGDSYRDLLVRIVVLVITAGGYAWCLSYLARPYVKEYFGMQNAAKSVGGFAIESAVNERTLVWASSTMLLLCGVGWMLFQRYNKPFVLPPAVESNARGTPLPSIRTQ